MAGNFRCKVKFVYAREIDVTEKTTASHLMDFYVRDRKALRDLDTKGSIVYDGKVYNIKYVNPINTLLEIRGQYVGEAKN